MFIVPLSSNVFILFIEVLALIKVSYHSLQIAELVHDIWLSTSVKCVVFWKDLSKVRVPCSSNFNGIQYGSSVEKSLYLRTQMNPNRVFILEFQSLCLLYLCLRLTRKSNACFLLWACLHWCIRYSWRQSFM